MASPLNVRRRYCEPGTPADVFHMLALRELRRITLES